MTRGVKVEAQSSALLTDVPLGSLRLGSGPAQSIKERSDSYSNPRKCRQKKCMCMCMCKPEPTLDVAKSANFDVMFQIRPGGFKDRASVYGWEEGAISRLTSSQEWRPNELVSPVRVLQAGRLINGIFPLSFGFT